MKVAFALAALVVASSALLQDTMEFDDFKSWFGKTYENTAAEAHAHDAFDANMMFITKHNAAENRGVVQYRVGVNEFSDLSPEEFARWYLPSQYNSTAPRREVTLPAVTRVTGLEDGVDWRQKGAVTPIKNQGQCGSCWAFSTTGSTEGAWEIAGNTLTALSEQQLMDCSKSFGNNGCEGGLMDYAFKYIVSNGGIDTEADYPYTAENGQCNTAKQSKHAASITSYQDVPHDNEAQLAAAVNHGPVSVAIEADQQGFQFYKSGVFGGPCGTNLDHGVLVVGYTDTYWIVKNSWGETWGQQGYIFMKRGVSASGICGILMQPSYPLAGKGPGPSPPSPPPPPPPPSGKHHYGNPADGCMSDEEAVQIENIPGDFCSPSCSTSSPCSSDVPSGTTADPQCVLETQGSSSPTQCALVCKLMTLADGTVVDRVVGKDGRVADHGCPTGATCEKVQLFEGICTYPSS